MKTYCLLSPSNAAIIVLILISVVNSNAIESISGQSSNSVRSHQNKDNVDGDLNSDQNVNVFKSKVDPEQDLAITGSGSRGSRSLIGMGYLGPGGDYHYKNKMVFIDEKQNDDPVSDMITSRCDDEFDPRCQFVYVADEYDRDDGDIMKQSSYGRDEIPLGFESSNRRLPASKRRLRFVKRRLRFIKRDEEDEDKLSSLSPIAKRRLRFVKKDDEENSVGKRRLRFIKRRLRFHKKDYGGVYPYGTDESPFVEYDSPLAFRSLASPAYYDLAKEDDDVVKGNTNGRFLPHSRYSSRGSRHTIKRRSAPNFPSLDPLSLDSTLSKRGLSISQPMQLITNMILSQEIERRRQHEKELANLLKLGKRSDTVMAPKTNDQNAAAFSKVWSNFVRSLISRPKDQSEYSI